MSTTSISATSRLRFALGIALSILLAVTVSLGSTTPVSAASGVRALAAAESVQLAGHPVKTVTASCGGGRCTVYLSKSETSALGRGSVPAPPGFVAGPLRVAYYALAYGHRWFAGQYAARGWCSGFRLSIYPWESQGYFGYQC
jgi:uncharacterized low-complexity protein